MAYQRCRNHKRQCPSWDRLPNCRLASQLLVPLGQVPIVSHRFQLGRRLTYIYSNRPRCCAPVLLGTKFSNRNLITGVPTVPVLGCVSWRFLGEQGRRGR
jgi:hypothetical protein